MKRPRIWWLRTVVLFKRLFLLGALAAAIYGGYEYFLLSRPDLPQVGAEWVAYQYLRALQAHNYEAAYMLVSRSAQSETSPAQMAQACGQIYSSIDGWQLGTAKYRFTHTSATVPVMLRYRAAWSPNEVSVMSGNLDFKLDMGEWRLVVAIPFATAIMKQRDEQLFGSSR